uniref:Uncharacterized protein n=1 Tax=Opuntia streptacantha TaxID=393608 RepID=A0A7C8ZI94_OPUST
MLWSPEEMMINLYSRQILVKKDIPIYHGLCSCQMKTLGQQLPLFHYLHDRIYPYTYSYNTEELKILLTLLFSSPPSQTYLTHLQLHFFGISHPSLLFCLTFKSSRTHLSPPMEK